MIEERIGIPMETGKPYEDSRVSPLPNGWKESCGAKKRDGSPCRRPPLAGRKRCALHGGKTPVGVASPHFRHGRESKYLRDLPDALRSGYKAALADESLLSLRDELAVLETRSREVMRQMEATPAPPWSDAYSALSAVNSAISTGDTEGQRQALLALQEVVIKGADAARTYEGAWTKLLDIIERKTKVAAAEWKRLNDLNGVISVEQALCLMKAFMSAARETITDAKMLQNFQQKVIVLLPPPEEERAEVGE